ETQMTDGIAPQRPLEERLLGAAIGALEIFGVHLGDRLGLYRALRDAPGGFTAAELARAAGIAPRYAREWLEQQAVAGYLEVVPGFAGASAENRRFRLPPEHARVLTEPDDPAHLAPLAR